MKLAVGDKVMAKWPGSALYYHAKVIAINDNDTANVLFVDDGTEMEIAVKFVKPESTFTSRTKSPSRTRRRSKSPGRSPGRKGQVLKKQEDETSNARTPRSSSRNQVKVLTSSSSSSDEKKTVIKSVGQRSEKVEIITKTKKSKIEVSTGTLASPGYMVTRRRAINKMMMSPVVQLENTDISKHIYVKEKFPLEYGGTLGVFITYLTTPLIPFVMLVACTEQNCSITKFTSAMISTKWQTYFSVKAFAIMLGFMLFHAIIYALPFGYVIKGPCTPRGNRLEYRISALYTLFITAATYAIAVFRFKYSFAFLHEELLRLAVAGTVISYIATILMYIVSFWVPKRDLNAAADTGSFLYDSFLGRVLHPRVGKLFDLKLYLYRPAMAGWLVLIWMEMGRDYDQNGQHSVQFLIVALSQILYVIMEFFYDEEQCPYMLDIKNEGLGFVQLIGEIVIVPFVYSMPLRYVMYYPSHLSNPKLILIASLLLAGFYLVFWSGRTKSLFRKNPYDSRVAGLESLPPSKLNGDRLLVCGLWGLVRHPNYLGEILIGLAWSVTCGYRHLLPWFYPVYLTVLLCHRSLRDDVRCQMRHGDAWKTYCQRVKYRVIPGIF